jgi:hypothetical protein
VSPFASREETWFIGSVSVRNWFVCNSPRQLRRLHAHARHREPVVVQLHLIRTIYAGGLQLPAAPKSWRLTPEQATKGRLVSIDVGSLSVHPLPCSLSCIHEPKKLLRGMLIELTA